MAGETHPELATGAPRTQTREWSPTPNTGRAAAEGEGAHQLSGLGQGIAVFAQIAWQDGAG